MKNLANFHQSMFESLKFGFLLGPFIESAKCMSSKFTEELCVMRMMKNDTKFDEDLTCQLKIGMSNLMNFESNT